MNAFDFPTARHLMVEQQVRPWDIGDRRVLAVLADLPREDFVPDAQRRIAYVDMMLPIGHGEVIWPARLQARLLQTLALAPTDRVLEVGTGTGYLTACLARLAGHVTSVDRHADFVAAARDRLQAHHVANVTLSAGDAAAGWQAHAPYDAIAVNGSLPEYPEALARQLAVGGRLFVIVGRAPVMHALRVTRHDAQTFVRDVLFETEVPPLSHAPVAPDFRF